MKIIKMYFLSQRKIKIDNSIFGQTLTKSKSRAKKKSFILFFRMRINGRGNKNCGFR